MYWTLDLASHLEDAPWPATRLELIDYAERTGAPLRQCDIGRAREVKTDEVIRLTARGRGVSEPEVKVDRYDIAVSDIA